jgi:nitronate monooxygenase
MGIGISLAGLASAVARQGGIGVIAGAMAGIAEADAATDPTGANIRALRNEIRTAKSQTDGILGVNIMVALTHYPDLVRTAVEEGIDIIFSGAGLPMDLPAYRPEGSRTLLAPIVSSAKAATLIAKKWHSRFGCVPDAFVVEGPMAGGHLGFKVEQLDDPRFALENLVSELLQAVSDIEDRHGCRIPVIAAGGIYTGGDICRFLKLGAAGVQMGTRFVATHECDADTAFKQAYVDAREEDLVIIKSPVGMPGRALRNVFLEDVGEGKKKPFRCPYHCIKPCDPERSPYCISMALACAKKGKFKNGFAFAGQNAYRVSEIVSVKELMDSLAEEYGRACRSAAA